MDDSPLDSSGGSAVLHGRGFISFLRAEQHVRDAHQAARK